MNLILKSKQVIDSTTDSKKLFSLLLKNRQIKDSASFINPPHPQDLNFPLPQLEGALKRIQHAIDHQQKILIYGDYDVDGICATALLWTALSKKNAVVTPFIPHRQKDGYGFNARSYQSLKQDFDLVITVDNGIVAQKEIKKIKADFIIVDHHLPDKTKPKTIAIIHSTQVCAGALSWFLAKKIDPNADLALATLATVADCLPLLDINRSIVSHGLKTFATTKNFGLQKLIAVSNLKPDSISSGGIGFTLAPRINAIGRLSDPMDALRLLCATTPAVADKYARLSQSLNSDRQQLQTGSYQLAKTAFDPKNKLIFVSDPSFHPGIIGLIAGRLTQEYFLPSIAVSIEDGLAKGSCRSIPQLNIIQTLRQFSDLFIDLGGHSQAAGFSLKTDNLEKLQKKLTAYVNKKLAKYIPEASLEVDAQMKLSAVTVKNCRLLQKLEPFGLGNPHPLFYFKDLKITQKRLLGQNQDHLKLVIDDPNTKTVEKIYGDAIAFRQGHLDGQIKVGDYISFVAELDLNIWNNTTTPQLIIKQFITN